MTLSIKLLKCFHCHNVSNNPSEELTSDEYCGLCEIRCSRCKTKWLVEWLVGVNISTQKLNVWLIGVNISTDLAVVWLFPLGCYIPQWRVRG